MTKSEPSPAGAPLPVSVVIPAFNRPEMTRRAVLSALAQRPFAAAEVIVVDDCSTDDTGAVAAAAGARVVRHERNMGEGAARNTGIGAATQPWIGLLDSDDEWRPNLLAALWPLRDGHVLLVGSAMYRRGGAGADRNLGPMFDRPSRQRTPTALLYPSNFVPNSAVLVRADAVRDAGGYRPELRMGADLDLWLRVLERGTGIMSPEVVVDYHLHPGQVTQDRDSTAEYHLRILRSYEGRPWFSAARVEGWRGGVGWDEMRRSLRAGRLAAGARAGLFVARHPARIAGLAGILFHRHRMRRRTAQLRALS
ncbi:MAG TPA: glycosyltransferase family 2 protein [Solirubrobacteraceae bacterium]|nr:glycosyltransferase family 2 protein [Solirubrobacteraceae bacterium]